MLKNTRVLSRSSGVAQTVSHTLSKTDLFVTIALYNDGFHKFAIIQTGLKFFLSTKPGRAVLDKIPISI